MTVAFAFALYCHATGDGEYLRRQAWQVLRGVAEWIASRGVDTPRGFEIHECLGTA
jgi:trehalose/maltose hydrolase-like predicted phosphorylase